MKICHPKNCKIILISFFLFSLSAILFTFFSDLSFPDDISYSSKGDRAKLYPQKPLFQVFTATSSNLNHVYIKIKNVSAIEVRDTVDIQLLDESCSQIVVQDRLSILDSFFEGDYDFSFDPIPDSKNKNYCLELTYERRGNKNENWLYVSASSDPQFENSSYTNTGKGGEFKGRSLVIKPTYDQGGAINNLKTLNNRMSQYKPWFFKGVFLQTLFLLFFISTIILVGLLIL